MAKYAPLVRFLRRQRSDEVDLSFQDIERIITAFLPKAAAAPEWWRANDCPEAPAQQRAFAEAGFIPEPLSRAERVRFRRADGAP